MNNNMNQNNNMMNNMNNGMNNNMMGNTMNNGMNPSMMNSNGNGNRNTFPIDLTNNNKECVYATFKVELYNTSKEVVGVQDGYFSSIPGKITSYSYVYIPSSTSFDSYKVTSVTLKDSSFNTIHNKDIEILSKTINEGYLVTQFKNKSKDKLDGVELGVLFYDAKGDIIGFSYRIVLSAVTRPSY